MMNKSKRVVIFGDSWAQKNTTIYNFTWPEKLENKYEVHNFARDGTSLDWSLQQLGRAVKDNLFGESTVMIFFLTDPWRQNWSFFEQNHQFLAKWLVEPPRFWLKDKELKETINPYLRYKGFSRIFFRNVAPRYAMRETTKTIGMINLMAGMYEKILIVPNFEKIDLRRIKLHDNIDVWDPMIDILGKKLDYNDNQCNHLPEEHHKTFLLKLESWIDNDVQV